jgi:hypothetical protein
MSGRAAAGRRVRLLLGPAESTPGWHQLVVSFVDAALPGRPVERVSTPFVVRVSSPPRSLPAAEAAARIAPRFWLEP